MYLLDLLFKVTFIAILLFTLGPLGNILCRALLRWSKISSTSNIDLAEKNANAGRIIGLMERILMIASVVIKDFNILTGVIALKALARYQELDKQVKAEYFLVGSLFSIIWTLLCAWIFATLDFHFKFNIVKFIQDFF